MFIWWLHFICWGWMRSTFFRMLCCRLMNFRGFVYEHFRLFQDALWSTVLVPAEQLWSAFHSDAWVRTSTLGSVCVCVFCLQRNTMCAYLNWHRHVGRVFGGGLHVYLERNVFVMYRMAKNSSCAWFCLGYFIFLGRLCKPLQSWTNKWGWCLCEGCVDGRGSSLKELEGKCKSLDAVMLCFFGEGSGVCVCVCVRRIWQISPSKTRIL